MTNKTCLTCTYWQARSNIIDTTRFGGKCLLSDKDSREWHTCWAWKVLSPKQMDQRKEAGMVKEVEK